jgi:hypothetical protein
MQSKEVYSGDQAYIEGMARLMEAQQPLLM